MAIPQRPAGGDGGASPSIPGMPKPPGAVGRIKVGGGNRAIGADPGTGNYGVGYTFPITRPTGDRIAIVIGAGGNSDGTIGGGVWTGIGKPKRLPDLLDPRPF